MEMIKNSIGQLSLVLDKQLSKICTTDPIVTEEELKVALGDYNLKEGLTLFASQSVYIFNQRIESPYSWVSASIIRHASGIILSQFIIEYLSNILIISRANDYKKASLKDKDNFLGLFSIYSSSIINVESVKKGALPILIRSSFQQFRSQRTVIELFGRQISIFQRIIKSANVKCTYKINLERDFKITTSLDIDEVLRLSFGIFSIAVKNPINSLENIIDAQVSGWENILKKDKVIAYMNLYSSNYSKFRSLDKSFNSNIGIDKTKSRFNPLWKTPIINIGKNEFIIPSLSAFTLATFDGLFWWFDEYYKGQDKQMDFRTYFGVLFENYVGDVLKDIYGKINVLPPINYGTKGKKIDFIDWTVNINGKLYLFESKAHQLSLESLQSGDSVRIENEIAQKVAKAIMQVFKRINDIEQYQELFQYRAKKVIPIIVFYDLPFISTSIYSIIIKNALRQFETDNADLQDFNYYLIGIEDLEDFYYCSEDTQIEDLLEIVKNNSSTSLDLEIKKRRKSIELKNYPSRVFENYMSSLIPQS